jgi:DNA-binding winged helix-turn-helix (wHTH) protein
MGPGPPGIDRDLVIEVDKFTVTYRRKSCFLGNTLPFRFLSRLAQRPNTFISHETLLSDVWDGNRTDSSIRSIVKTLRRKLRQAGLTDLADAIDGSVPGHYSLKLSS